MRPVSDAGAPSADVLLACMPFGAAFSPSIGLALLKAQLTRAGIRSRVVYFSLAFAERIGQHLYCGIASEGRPSVRELAGEWIFARALQTVGSERGLREATPVVHGNGLRAKPNSIRRSERGFKGGRRSPPLLNDDDRYVSEILRKSAPGAARSWDKPASPALVAQLLKARDGAEAFLEECLDEIVRLRPRIVGFTSVFQQHVASLALARRVKLALPQSVVVMGGANCEGPMGAETVRQFPFVDAAVSGEADLVFPELVRRVLEGRPLDGLAGVWTPESAAAGLASGRFPSAPMVQDMDALPYPDYDDYFEQFGASPLSREWQPGIFFESSRGCWWGERMHCTFCGLNGSTMAYRSKSAARALDEIEALSRKHPGCDVQVTDNILDLGYFKDFLPALASRRLDLDLFYETKSNLRKDQIRLLRRAGISRLQPGIESLSDAVLKLMRKGVSGLQNIQLLKWCREIGVAPHWNVLWGFPGEPPEEYTRLAGVVPLLTHLPAPVSFGPIRLDRFSPNFFDAERLGFADVTPLGPYRHIYRLPDDALANLAYYFAYSYKEPRDVEAYVRPLERRLREWQRVGRKSFFFSVDLGDCLLLWDLRPGRREPLRILRGVERALYQACDAASDLRQLASALERAGTPLAPEALAAQVASLVACGALLQDGARYLALALPLGEYVLPERAVDAMRDVLRTLGRRCKGGFRVPLDTMFPARRPAAPLRERSQEGRAPGRSFDPSHFRIDREGQLVVRLL